MQARYKLPTLQVVDFQIALQLKHGWEVEIKWAFIHCDGNKRIGSANGAETIKKQNSQGEKCVLLSYKYVIVSANLFIVSEHLHLLT